MPRETAEQFAIDIIGYAYDWVVSDTELAKLIRARDLETAKEMRERASKHRMVRRDGELSECVCGWKPFSCNIAAEWKSHILSVPLDPPAEEHKAERMVYIPSAHPIEPPAEDKVCPRCEATGIPVKQKGDSLYDMCPDCHGTGRQRAQGEEGCGKMSDQIKVWQIGPDGTEYYAAHSEEEMKAYYRQICGTEEHCEEDLRDNFEEVDADQEIDFNDEGVVTRTTWRKVAEASVKLPTQISTGYN